jgi:hypothetical protein
MATVRSTLNSIGLYKVSIDHFRPAQRNNGNQDRASIPSHNLLLQELLMTSSSSRRPMLTAAILSLTVSASLWSGAINAQESDNWEFRLTPYLWFLGLDGTTSVLGQDVDVDASFGDILDVLNIALFVNMELSKGKFFVVFDPMYSQLEAEFETSGSLTTGGTVDIDMVIADLNVGYKIGENFDLYAGMRYYDQDIGITPNALPVAPTLGDDWTDFILGFRVRASVSEKWSFKGKLDGAVGGDSESAWYLQAVMLRHFGSNKHLDLGWRYYDADYESGSGVSRFKWDVVHSGPVIGFSWKF